MADQREAVESARAAHGACTDGEPCRFVFDSECSLARAVIALDEECRRLRDLLADVREAIPPVVDAGTCDDPHCGEDMREHHCTLTETTHPMRLRIDAEIAAQPAPASPGASEPSEADVEAVAKRLMIVWMEHQEQLDGCESMLSGMSFDEASALAREAIRLGARVPR